ncbi:hypothetical protein MUU72_04800 [Streptomyces sp. RS10V-4]|uniref:hypothetical protein n=1 Tax=Streptomyces rhizoryzae TaxID=2932493 RepID=UPI00200413EF|nr:hypothetical protein [Streptomyces rhizoryzae]MCK7622439.1 hypothetical protein [Streptomyces rhizoryzae]
MARPTQTVFGVLTEPTPPSWWKANRHKVFGVVGLLIGYWIGTHFHGAPDPQPPSPRPAHGAPARADTGLHHTATVTVLHHSA